MSNDNETAIYRKNYQEPNFWIRHVDLAFDLREGESWVTARMHISRNGKHNKPLVLDGEELELTDIKLNGIPLDEDSGDYAVDDKSLTVNGGVLTDDQFLLETKVRIEPEKNTKLEGLYKSGDIWCTQCEAEGFRRITYFIDRPDNMTTYSTTIVADPEKAPVLLSNGNTDENNNLVMGHKKMVRWDDPIKKPSYLFALVAGDLGHIEGTYETKSGRNVLLRLYAEKKDLAKLAFARDALKDSIGWFEDNIGHEYDLDHYNIVAIDNFNAFAMENKGLNIFNTEGVLADPRISTDHDFLNVLATIAHEGFHNVYGNRITMRDMFQLTNKEGIVVFLEHEFMADRGSRPVKRIEDVLALRQNQFMEDAGDMAHPIRPNKVGHINNFYSYTVYDKGGEVVRMQRTLLGENGFRKGLALYSDRHDGQAVTCDDFLKCMEDASGKDLSQFSLWYSQAGTPMIDAYWDYNAQTKQFKLKLKQTIPDTPDQTESKQPMHIPVAFGLVGKDGNDVVLDTATGNTEKLLELQREEEIFVFDNIPEGAVPSILRDFSAPVILNAPYSDDDLRHLMVYDSDGFNQWEAGQRFITNRMLEQIDRAEQGQPVDVSKDVIEAFRGILARQDIDNRLKDLALTLPGFNTLSQKRDVVDPQAIITVRKAFEREIGNALLQKWVDTYSENELPNSHPYALNNIDIGKRAMKNTALYYMMTSEDPAAGILALKQYHNSTNMTDRLASLEAILGHESGKSFRMTVLNNFYNDLHDEDIALNKWFGAQAGSGQDDIISIIKTLAKHPDFIKKEDGGKLNPNRTGALYGGFASNPESFHAEDGSGYQLIADFIIEADPINSSLSSGIIDKFSDYKRYRPDLRDKMKAELERINAMPKKSAELQEKLDAYLSPGRDQKPNPGPAPTL